MHLSEAYVLFRPKFLEKNIGPTLFKQDAKKEGGGKTKIMRNTHCSTQTTVSCFCFSCLSVLSCYYALL